MESTRVGPSLLLTFEGFTEGFTEEKNFLCAHKIKC